MLMPFGKYKGRRLDEIPIDYLIWCVNNIDSLDSALFMEMKNLIHARTAKQLPIAESVRSQMRDAVKQWYRRASLKHHPDHGGSNERQLVVNECYRDLLAGVNCLEVNV
jgi:uncharacterized protein (DUF3820 family)